MFSIAEAESICNIEIPRRVRNANISEFSMTILKIWNDI